MMQLAQLQDAMLADIYAGTQTSATHLAPGHAERLAIFSNNTRLQLTSVLADTFPVLYQLVGEQAFNMLGRGYQQAHPLQAANVHDYGKHMAAFLPTFTPFQEYTYFADMAALEYAVFQAHLAPDARALTMEELQARLTEPAFSLPLHPSVRLVNTAHDVLPIWQNHQGANDNNEQLVLVAEQQHYLVWRDQQHALSLQNITPAMMVLIQSSKHNKPFGAAMAAAIEQLETEADLPILQQAFGALVVNGVFAASKL